MLRVKLLDHERDQAHFSNDCLGSRVAGRQLVNRLITALGGPIMTDRFGDTRAHGIYQGAVAGGGTARYPAKRSPGVFLARAGLSGSAVGIGHGGRFQCSG